MRLIYRPIVTWPGKRTEHPKPSPFEAGWSDTLEVLDRELWYLRAEETVLQVDSPNERDFRLDGQLRADAKLRSGAVILNVESKKHGQLQYPCDTFTRRGYREKLQPWQVNVRAIALGLEALRKLERYGIANTGQQYTGWKALGSGIPMPAKTEMSLEEAARFICQHAGPILKPPAEELIADKTARERYFRVAAGRLHPDRGGDPELFKQLTIAMETLEKFV